MFFHLCKVLNGRGQLVNMALVRYSYSEWQQIRVQRGTVTLHTHPLQNLGHSAFSSNIYKGLDRTKSTSTMSTIIWWQGMQARPQ